MFSCIRSIPSVGSIPHTGSLDTRIGFFPSGKKSWSFFGVLIPYCTELFLSIFFFALSKPCVHPNKNWQHDKCQEGRPLQEKSKHNQYEANILRMADTSIRAGDRESVFRLSFVKNLPCFREEYKAVEN